jgi:arginyl-tRNA synthetase
LTLYARFAAHLHDALDALEREGQLAPGVDRGGLAVEPPRDPSHGDLATNAAMVLAKRAGTNPRALAALIASALAQHYAIDLPRTMTTLFPNGTKVRGVDGLIRT